MTNENIQYSVSERLNKTRNRKQEKISLINKTATFHGMIKEMRVPTATCQKNITQSISEPQGSTDVWMIGGGWVAVFSFISWGFREKSEKDQADPNCYCICVLFIKSSSRV